MFHGNDEDRPRSHWTLNGLIRHAASRLHIAAPEVIALLDGNPFPDGQPTYVRVLLYEYRMTDRETRRHTGAW
jgi:hypothetical protein